MHRIRIDFYKRSGKWYSGGTMDIPDDLRLYEDRCEGYLRAHQDILMGGGDEFIMVVGYDDPDSFFFNHLFPAREA